MVRAAPQATVNEVPWAIETETRKSRLARRGKQLLIWVPGIILSAVGLQTLIAGPSSQPAPAPVATPFQDVPGAQAVAARWVTTQLSGTSSSTADQQRQALMALDAAPGWTPSTELTQGKVTRAFPGTVTAQDSQHAVVDVLTQINPVVSGTRGTGWISVQVPVGWDGRRVVVTGDATLAGTPRPQNVRRTVAGVTDTALSAQTQSTVVAALKAMADDPQSLDQLAAPNSRLAPITGTGVTLRTVQSWTAYAGTGNSRIGDAVVLWSLPTGGTLRGTYRITLSTVSDSAASSYRVAAIRAADAN